MKFDDNSEIQKTKGIQLNQNYDNINFDNLKKLVDNPLAVQRCSNSGFVKYGPLICTYQCRRNLQPLYIKRVLEPGFVTTRSIDMQAKEDGVKPAKRGRPKGKQPSEEEKKEAAAKRQRVRRQKIKVANVLESSKEKIKRNIIEEAAADGEPLQKKIKLGNDTITVKVPEWLSITGFSITVATTKK